MMSPIAAPSFKASPILPVVSDFGADTQATQSGNTFKAILSDSIQQIQNSDKFASQSVEQFLSGENSDLHQVAIAAQKAELTFEFYLQARNKVVSAYQEIMRMQL